VAGNNFCATIFDEQWATKGSGAPTTQYHRKGILKYGVHVNEIKHDKNYEVEVDFLCRHCVKRGCEWNKKYRYDNENNLLHKQCAVNCSYKADCIGILANYGRSEFVHCDVFFKRTNDNYETCVNSDLFSLNKSLKRTGKNKLKLLLSFLNDHKRESWNK